MDVRTFEKVEDVRREGSGLRIESNKGSYWSKRVVLAAGKAGNPRKAGVPGEVEFAPKIDHRLIDPDLHEDQDIFVYGGGDVALEGALSLCETNRVTLVTIDPEFVYPKKRNVDAVMGKVAEGKIALHFDSFLKEIGDGNVTFSTGGVDGEARTIPNDHVFEMIGAELPLGFFKKVGIQLENTWHAKRWFALAAAFVFVYSLYALKSYGKGISAWPFQSLISPETYDSALGTLFRVAFLPFGWVFTDEAYRDILGDRGYQQGYLYSLLYTIVMVVFGLASDGALAWHRASPEVSDVALRLLDLVPDRILPDREHHRGRGVVGAVRVAGVGALPAISALLQRVLLVVRRRPGDGEVVLHHSGPARDVRRYSASRALPRQTVLHLDLRLWRVGRDARGSLAPSVTERGAVRDAGSFRPWPCWRPA